MPQGVCEKPQRRTASALSSADLFSEPLPRTEPRRYVCRTTLIPQYIDSRRECSSPSAVVAPPHDNATASSAEASDTWPEGAASASSSAVRGPAITMPGLRTRCPFAPVSVHSCREIYIHVRFSYVYVLRT